MLRSKLYPEDIPEPRMFDDKLCKSTGYKCFVMIAGTWLFEFVADDGDLYYGN